MKSTKQLNQKLDWTTAILCPCLALFLFIAPLATAIGQTTPDKPVPPPASTNNPPSAAPKPAVAPAPSPAPVAPTQTPPPAPAPAPTPAPAPAAPAHTPAPAAETPTIQLSFQGASIDMVAQWLAQTTGKSVVKSPKVNCQLNIMSSKKLTIREAVNTVYRALSLEGFSVTETSNSILIGPEGQEPKLTPELLGSTNDIPEGKQRLVKVFALQHTLPTEMCEKIRGVLSEKATIDADDPSSRIIITDYNDNINQAKNMISALDLENPAEITVHVIHLNNMSAAELSREVSPMVQRGKGQKEIAAIFSNDQANSLIVVSTEAGFKKIEKIATTLDSKGPANLSLHVLPIKHMNVYALVRVASPVYQRFALHGETLDISINDQSNSLVILTSESIYKEVEKIVQTLDTEEPSDVAVRIIPIKHVDAPTLAAQISPLCRRLGGKNTTIDIMPDYQGNSLIILSCESDYQTILKIATALDSDDHGDLALRTIPVKNVNAYTLVRMAAPFYTRLSGRGKKEIIEVNVNDANNSLVVFSSESNFHQVEKIVQTLDTEEPGGIAVRVIPIKNSDAPTLAAEIAPLCRRIGGKGQNNAIDIVADGLSNSLIVLSCETDYQSVLKIVEELDTVDRGDLSIRSIPLKHVNANTIVRVAAPFYQRLAGRGRKDIIEVSVNDQNNSLVVFSNEANYKTVEKIILELDTEEPGGIAVRVLNVKHIDAGTLAAEIAPLCRRVGGKGQNNAIDIVADGQSNALIILSCESDYNAVQKIVASLDTDERGDMKVRTITLKHVSASVLSREIGPLCARMSGKGQNNMIDITANDVSNTLIILSTENNFKAIEKIVETLDNDNREDVTVHIITLNHVNAVQLSREILPLCQRLSTRGQKDFIDVIANEQSNSLIVVASDSNFQAVENIVTALDTEKPEDVAIRTIPLKFVNAQDLSREVTPLCQRMSGRGQKDVIEITANEKSNCLMVLSSQDNFHAIERIVANLDVDNRGDLAVRVITLKHMNAQDLAREVGPLYQKISGKEVSAKGRKDTIEITSNDRSNSLIVLSSADNFKAIEQLVMGLDTAEAQEKAMKVFPLTNADAQDVARQLETLFQNNEVSSSRYFFYGYGNRNDSNKRMSVVADRRRNSLIIQAPPIYMETISNMVHTLDAPITDDSLTPKIYPLKYVNASDIEDLLNELFLKKSTQRSYWSMFEDSDNTVTDHDVGRLYGKVRIISEPHANAIIITANSLENMSAVESVLKQLDVPSEAGDSTLRIPLNHAKADTVANSINILFARGGSPTFRPTTTPQQNNTTQQNNNNNNTGTQSNFELTLDAREDTYFPWLGGPVETYSRNGDRNGMRPISDLIGRVRVVADHRGNALLISANMHYFPQILKLINEMDAPSDQVMIDAKLLEVSSDYLDKLGVRWGPTGNTSFTSDDYDDSMVATSKSALSTALHSGYLSNTMSLDVLVQFMRKTGDASVLAEPKINIADNEMGHLFVGSQVPFIDKSQSTDTGGLNQSFSYKNVGIILEVTPHINKQGDIALRIRAESSAIETGQTLFGGAIVDTRNFQTDLTAKDGETLVLGGIIQKQISNVVRKVPFLGDIPGLGYLFKKKDTVTKNVELMVFLRPRIVCTTNANDARKLMEEAQKETPLIQKWQADTKEMDEERVKEAKKEAKVKAAEKAKRDAKEAKKEQEEQAKEAKEAQKAQEKAAKEQAKNPAPANTTPAQQSPADPAKNDSAK